jgi:hypothetical protein
MGGEGIERMFVRQPALAAPGWDTGPVIAADAGTWALVLVTGGLAIVTGFMAVSTRKAARSAARAAAAAEADIRQGAELVATGQRQVEAAQRQVELAGSQAALAQKSLEIESQPLLVPTTPLENWDPNPLISFTAFQVTSEGIQDFPVAKTWTEGQRPWLAIRIRNIGRGTALVGAEITDVVLEVGGNRILGQLSASALAPEDRAFAVSNGQANQPGQQSTFHSWVQIGNDFRLEIRYCDIARSRWFVTSCSLGGERPCPVATDVHFVEEDGAA